MSIRVHRTEIPIDDVTELRLRGYVRSIHVAPHRRTPDRALEVWYECVDDVDVDLAVRFRVYGTGHSFTHRSAAAHIGTVVTHGGRLVWHVYTEFPGNA